MSTQQDLSHDVQAILCFRSYFQIMPQRKRCLICLNHTSMKRRGCILCHQRRALPGCVPEQCFIWSVGTCRDCFESVFIPDLPNHVSLLILQFLDGEWFLWEISARSILVWLWVRTRKRRCIDIYTYICLESILFWKPNLNEVNLTCKTGTHCNAQGVAQVKWRTGWGVVQHTATFTHSSAAKELKIESDDGVIFF